MTNTDAYWVGAFAMAIARALHALRGLGDEYEAERELQRVLDAFAESPVLDDGLRAELAPYWQPGEERQ